MYSSKFVGNMLSCINAVLSFKCDSQEFTRAFNKSIAYKMPRYERQYLAGIRDYIVADLYQNKLEYGAFHDGVFVSTHNGPEYYENFGLSALDFNKLKQHGHYWRGTKGTKAWFVAD